jgi:FKBP-type peptidyl-prolyl cis-trans isomerase
MKLQNALIVAGLMTFSAIAQEPKPPAKPLEPPDKQKLSYALGMNLGLQIKHISMDADIDVVARGIKDVLEGKGTEIQEPEIRPLLKQAEDFGRLRQVSKKINEGVAFLAKNAREPGITVLPDGLQYRVIKTGTGEFPKRTELVTLNFKGTWIDGKEFRHNDRLDIPFLGCTKGLQEALLLMKVGSKWQIYVPYNLAYGRLKDRAVGFGSALIYDLELISAESESAHPNQHHGPGGQAGHSLDEALLPPIFRSSMENTSETK